MVKKLKLLKKKFVNVELNIFIRYLLILCLTVILILLKSLNNILKKKDKFAAKTIIAFIAML